MSAIGIDLPNAFALLAFLALLFWIARKVALHIAGTRSAAVLALWLWLFEFVGLAASLAFVYLIWDGAGRPTEGCSGCEIFWAPFAIMSTLLGAGLGLFFGWLLLRRRARA